MPGRKEQSKGEIIQVVVAGEEVEGGSERGRETDDAEGGPWSV